MGKEKIFPVVGFVLLAGAVWAVYGRAVDAPFIFDDAYSVTGNPSITRLWPLMDEGGGPLNPPKDLPTSGRPLVNSSLAVNYHFGRLDPVGYHAFNLLVHVLSAMLLMGIVRRTLRLECFNAKFEHASDVISFVVALLWALHPLQSETIIYVTQRTELMVGFFYLAVLYTSLRYWAAGSNAARNKWMVLAVVAGLCGAACKEVMVTAPVIVLLFERTFISGSFRRALQKSWPLYLGLALSWVLLLVLNFDGPRAGTAGFHLGVSAGIWWLTQTKILLMYLKLAVWPWPLAIHYQMPYLKTIGAAWLWVCLALLLVVATSVLVWRRSALGFVGAWVLVILSPTLVVPILTEVAAERRMYLPLAALVALVVVGGYSLLDRAISNAASRTPKRWPAVTVLALSLMAAIVMSFVDARRLEAYHDPITLWQDLLASQPGNAKAHNNLAQALFETGQTEEAIAHIREALRLSPEFSTAYYNLGLMLSSSGRSSEAIEQFQVALRLKPDYHEAHNCMGKALASAGRLPEAIEHYQKAVQLKPDAAEAHNNLGLAFANSERFELAIEEYKKALRLEHDYADAHFNLSLTLRSIGKPQEAAAQCLEALRLAATAPKAWANLAMIYADMDRSTEAIAAGEKATKLARDQGQTALAGQLEKWLKEYSASQANKKDARELSESAPENP